METSAEGADSFDQELNAVLAPPGHLYRMNTTSVDIDDGSAQGASALPTPSAAAASLGKDVPASPPEDSKGEDKSKEPWTKSNDPWNKQKEATNAASSSGGAQPATSNATAAAAAAAVPAPPPPYVAAVADANAVSPLNAQQAILQQMLLQNQLMRF